MSSFDWPPNAGGSGTVTSVALTVPSFLNVSGSPITTNGTFAVTLATETANTVFAGPTSGGAATPAFRALVAADIPSLSYVTSVGFSVPATSIFAVTGTNPITSSGTFGFSVSGNSGGVPYFNSGSSLSTSATLTANAIMLGGGATIAPTTLGSLGTTTTVLHGNASGAPTFGAVSLTADVSGILPIANGGSGSATTSQNFAFIGPTSGSGAPSFRALVAGDVPALSYVTSVGLSVPGSSIFGVTGSPVTSSGTLGLTTTGTSGGIPYFSSTSAVSSSALLTANALVLGGGAGSAPVVLGSLGTTSTVLHGNAAGAPTFGAIVNADITNGTIDLTTKVTGALPIANGGTGQITAAAAITALAGTQAAGKVLRSDGTNTALQYPEPTILAKTSNYTTVANDNLITCDSSGGTFTITLLAAATAGSGKRYQILKTDTSFTAVTVTDGTLSTTLNTQNECLEVYSTGSAWLVLRRYVPSVATNFTPTGVWDNTTYTGQWKRIGDSAQINFYWVLTGTPTSASSFTLTIPSGLTIDVTKLANGSAPNTSSRLPHSTGSMLRAGNNEWAITANYVSTTAIGIVQVKSTAAIACTDISSQLTKSSPSSFVSGDIGQFSVLVPITGWNG